MGITRMFDSLFPRPASKESVIQRREAGRRRITSVLSRGNLSLQQGSYMTARQIAAKKEAVLKHKF